MKICYTATKISVGKRQNFFLNFLRDNLFGLMKYYCNRERKISALLEPNVFEFSFNEFLSLFTLRWFNCFIHDLRR